MTRQTTAPIYDRRARATLLDALLEGLDELAEFISEDADHPERVAHTQDERRSIERYVHVACEYPLDVPLRPTTPFPAEEATGHDALDNPDGALVYLLNFYGIRTSPRWRSA